LRHAESNFITLDEEIAILRMYLDLESLRFEGSFEYEINVDDFLEQEGVLIPSLVVQPFAENAIWHGLMHKEGNKTLNISFTNHHDDYMTCVVEDNGIGRKRSSIIQQRKLSSQVHESKGISIIQERLRLLQQKTGKPGRVEILDMYTDDMQAAGTKVIIIIPFYNELQV
jgi:LytS/YehU family sensor histidine kinase